MTKALFSGLDVFLAVAQEGSMRKAARALGVQPATVTIQLKAFEERIGVTLFERSTRRVSLTNAGQALLEDAAPAMMRLNTSVERIREMGSAHVGSIRLTMPYSAYRIAIEPRLASFFEAYPKIDLEFSFNEATVDIAGEGFHAGIRLGEWLEPDYVAIPISGALRSAYFGSPAYFAKHGCPERPHDLHRHECIRYRFINAQRIATWPFVIDGRNVDVRINGKLVIDNYWGVVDAARAGLGVGWALRNIIKDDLTSNTLVSVLDDFTNTYSGFFLSYPRESGKVAAFRAFADFMRV